MGCTVDEENITTQEEYGIWIYHSEPGDSDHSEPGALSQKYVFASDYSYIECSNNIHTLMYESFCLN